jgi:CAAX protease family protein
METRISLSPVHPRTFFILTYLLSWLIWIPLDLSHFGIGPFNIPEGLSNVVRLLGVLMPAVAALVLTSRAAGRGGVRNLLGRLAIWRVGWNWWAAAVLVQPVLVVVAGVVYNRFWGNPAVIVQPLGAVAAFVISTIFLAIASLGEEIGWRGVALPGLQSDRSALNASLILWFLWGIWHIPFWLLLDSFDQFGWSYLALNFLFGLPVTLYITWLFNHSRSSVLLAVAFHLSFNIVNTSIFPVTSNPGAFAVLIAIEWVVTLLFIRHLEPPKAQSV